MNVSMLRLFTSFSNNRRKAGATSWTLGQKVKGQSSGDFLEALIFWQDIWTHLGQFSFLLCTQIETLSTHVRHVCVITDASNLGAKMAEI